MLKSRISPLLLGLALSFFQGATARAQEAQPTPPEKDEQQQKDKAETEKRAYALLDQIVGDAQLLRLPENRISLQIDTADLLWDRNQARARNLFTSAADSVAEMMRNVDASDQRRGNNQARTASQLRQQLVLRIAHHDATLAYQVLASTRPSTTPSTDSRNAFRPDAEENLEQLLMARIASVDPKMALQNADQFLDKGQFPRTLANVLSQLQRTDKEAATKLEDKIVKRLQATNLLTSADGTGLALSLLRSGPRAQDTSATGTDTNPNSVQNNNSGQLLAPGNYVDLLGYVIDAALKATPQSNTNLRASQGNAGRRGNQRFAPGGGQNNTASAPTDTQIEQTNARGLLTGLQVMLPQIDQYLPGRGQSVRDKLTELGLVDNQGASMNQVLTLLRQGSTDNLLTAAPTAPAQMQPRIYQQAALKALEEGDADRARQIANDHLDGTTRARVLQQVEFRQISDKTASTKLDELRQTLNGLRSDEERVDLLIRLSYTTRENNPKIALQLLEQARQLATRRAANYQQFDQQLRVAEAFKTLEPARSFEVLEPGILQLNELLAAASTLSGFEVNVFRDGELPLDARGGLTNMVSRYGSALGSLASSDFDRAQTLANRFQLNEARILARMSIVQALLRTGQNDSSNPNFNFRGPGPQTSVQPGPSL
ncbi:MAG: hypothetical protein C5B44_04160 [Acidobacteria bacterium]|nr:MAG: hypothetical protein C5B44_04160 [Acidobacteriota bacterium]